MEKRNVYKGHRYVPKIMGEWNQEETYEGLSIVTHQGTSFTSKKRVPIGIDILDEEYWVVTGNYNQQVETYRQEVREFDNRISNNTLDIENTNTQLAQTSPSIYVEEFPRLENEQYDDERISRAIQKAYEMDGATVRLSSTKYTLTKAIEIKEDVYLKGENGTKLEFISDNGPVFIPHHKSRMSDFNVYITNRDFKGSVLLLDGNILNAVNRKDTSTNSRCYFNNIQFYGNFDETNTQVNSTAIKFIAETTGFWGITFNDIYIRGFRFGIVFETKGTGWINGNQFKNIEGIEMETLVKTIKSEDSLGVDWNDFDTINFQPTGRTRDVLVDGDGRNSYRGFRAWDLQIYKHAKLGIANSISFYPALSTNSHTILRGDLSSNGYYLLGRFARANSNFNEVLLSFKGRRFTYDSSIAIRSNGVTTRKHRGNTKLSNDVLKFYLRELDDGSAELYLKSEITSNITVATEETQSFTPAPSLKYDDLDLDSLVEIEVNDERSDEVENNKVKLDNGLLVMWGTYESTETELIKELSSGLLVKRNIDSVEFPEHFISTPNVQITSLHEERPISTTISSFNREGFIPNFILDSSISDANTFYISWQAVGRWK